MEKEKFRTEPLRKSSIPVRTRSPFPDLSMLTKGKTFRKQLEGKGKTLKSDSSKEPREITSYARMKYLFQAKIGRKKIKKPTETKLKECIQYITLILQFVDKLKEKTFTYYLTIRNAAEIQHFISHSCKTRQMDLPSNNGLYHSDTNERLHGRFLEDLFEIDWFIHNDFMDKVNEIKNSLKPLEARIAEFQDISLQYSHYHSKLADKIKSREKMIATGKRISQKQIDAETRTQGKFESSKQFYEDSRNQLTSDLETLWRYRADIYAPLYADFLHIQKMFATKIHDVTNKLVEDSPADICRSDSIIDRDGSVNKRRKDSPSRSRSCISKVYTHYEKGEKDEKESDEKKDKKDDDKESDEKKDKKDDEKGKEEDKEVIEKKENEICDQKQITLSSDKPKPPKTPTFDVSSRDAISLMVVEDTDTLNISDIETKRIHRMSVMRERELTTIDSFAAHNKDFQRDTDLDDETDDENEEFSLIEGQKSAIRGLISTMRHAVSMKKKRFTKDGFDLDLTYITDQIIAMGYPSEKISALYRNPMSEVQRFFNTKHPGKYRIYNLCWETYKPEKFDWRVANYPFDDHNPPPFCYFEDFCRDVDSFLSKSSDHVVAIHCLAGKGRTGVMIASYLLFKGKFRNVKAALDFYSEKRTYNREGVRVPSQLRFARYFSTYLKNPSIIPPHQPCMVTSIHVHSFPFLNLEQEDIWFQVQMKEYIYSSKDVYVSQQKPHLEGYICWNDIDSRCDLKAVDEDFLISIYRTGRMGKECVCSAWLNSRFFDPTLTNYSFKLSKKELDGPYKDKYHKIYPDSLFLEINLRRIQTPYSMMFDTLTTTDE